MHLLVFYDITDDGIRRKCASACADYGLDRTQFSAFVGDLTRSQQRELMRKLKNLLKDQRGAILMVPVSQPEWQQRQEHRQEAPGDGISTTASTIADREAHDGTLY
jgi:CRISPR-associated protein Cas2